MTIPEIPPSHREAKLHETALHAVMPKWQYPHLGMRPAEKRLYDLGGAKAVEIMLSLGYRVAPGWVAVTPDTMPPTVHATHYAGLASEEVATFGPRGLQFMRWVWYEDCGDWMYWEQDGTMDRVSNDALPTMWCALPPPPPGAPAPTTDNDKDATI